MDILGSDIARATFDVALLSNATPSTPPSNQRPRHASFSNTEAGFKQLLAWLARHRPDARALLHACMEATGNWGLDLAAFLHSNTVQVSVVNPARIRRTATASWPATKPTSSTPPSSPASAAPTPRPHGHHPRRTCASCANWSADATRSRLPASRNSIAKSQASPRP